MPQKTRAAELEGEIASLAAHINAATYRLIEMLREFDELEGWSGWPTPAHWLQWRCGYSLGAARERFRVARALPELPRIREAFRAGRLSFAQVRAVIRIATPQNEATLLMWAQHSTASQVEKFARLYRRYGENAAAMSQHRERSFTSWDEEDVSAETRRARRADALVRVAESYLEPDGRPRSLAEKYQVHVHLDLRRDADGPVADPDAPALAEETIRRLGCEAGLVPVLRDRGCRFPGCTHTRHVDAHHVRHWADGGETKLSNLVELCGRHHRLLHEGGYGLRVTDDGAMLFTRPDGERIPGMPRPLVLAGDHRHDVSAETFRCKWDGKPPDYGAMVQLLDGE